MEYFYFKQNPDTCRAAFALTHSGQMAVPESWQWLDKAYLDRHAKSTPLQAAIEAGEVMAVNQAHPLWQESQKPLFNKQGLRLNLLACGDVGSTILIGLRLLAKETISSIGIYDINPQNCQRWQFELNQVVAPMPGYPMPKIDIISKEELFDCDVFVFSASAGVPPLDSTGDVRMLQYEKNAAIISEYARQARNTHFKGLFAVVSDPVDQLCKAAYLASNQDENGQTDHLGLRPEQIEGYGLGVMYARACYYAQQDPRFASFLDEGRAYGPHGEGLIIANSISKYDDALSKELSALALQANREARSMGFKPYVAPALSSAVLNLLATLRGQWHYSSTFLGGIFFGCKNRRICCGIETEALPLDTALFGRIEHTAALLTAF